MSATLQKNGGTTRRNYNVKIKILTKDILKHLAEQDIKVGACVQDASLVTNLMTPERLAGEWVFEKPKKPVKTIKKPKKVKKTLDKSPEDVIIYIQEETLPSKE